MKIIFLAFSCKHYKNCSINIERPDLTRRMSCLETWVPMVEMLGHEVIFFEGNSSKTYYKENNKTLYLDCDDGYDYSYFKKINKPSRMIEKLKKAISWCLENKEFDYIFRTDDGSYINYFILNDFLKTIDSNDIVRNLAGGGGGVLMSKKVCEKLINWENKKNIYVEDRVLFNFFEESKFKILQSNMLCNQYVVGEKLFTIHYTNGKRMYYVHSLLRNYYLKNKKSKRNIVINYPLNGSMFINTWDYSDGNTPIWYSYTDNPEGWEYYGRIIRSDFEFDKVNCFGENAISSLFFYKTVIEKERLIDFLKSLNSEGKIYLFFNDKNEFKKCKIENIKIEFSNIKKYLNFNEIEPEEGYITMLDKNSIL